MDDLLEDSPPITLPFAFADDTTFGAQGCRVADCEAALQPAADHLHRWSKGGRSHSVAPSWSCLSSPEIQEKSTAKLFPKFILEQLRLPLNQLQSSWVSPWTAS